MKIKYHQNLNFNDTQRMKRQWYTEQKTILLNQF